MKEDDTLSRIAEYQALSPTPKALLQLLTVTVDSCRLDVVARCLHDLRLVNDQGRPISVASLQPLLDELTEKGLLLRSARGLSCPESVRRRAFYDMLIEETFAGMVKVMGKYLQYPATPPPSYHPKNYQQLLGDFQRALFYQGSLAAVHDLAYNQAFFSFRDDYYLNNPFLTVLNRPFSAEIIEKINPDIRLEILTDLVNAADSCLDSADDIITYINGTYSPVSQDKVAVLQLIHHSLLIGDTAGCRLRLSRLKGDLQGHLFGWSGWLEFISGRYEEALALFTESSRLLKKIHGRRKVFLQGFTGIFHLLTLLQTGEISALKQALDSIAIAKKNSYPLSPLMEVLVPVLQDNLGMAVSEPFVANLQYFQKNPQDILFLHLFRYWADNKKKIDIPLLRQTRDRAQENGYIWLAAEFSALLAALGQDEKTNREIAARLHAACITKSCLDIVRPQPQWEKTLNALLHISKTDQGAQAGKGAEQRLIWLFGYNEKYGFCHILPRIQKTTAKGTWSKGRPAALKTLSSDHHDIPGLTEQDYRVCQAIKEETYRSGWGYGKSEYVLDPDLALPALVGHPLLFLEDSPEVNVELVPAEPEVYIREEKAS